MTGIISDNVGRPSGLIKSAGGGGGVWTLIKTLTASADGTLSFVNGASDVVLDNTYPIYTFKFINIHPATDEANFQFNLSVDTGSNYNVTKTTTYFTGNHAEDDAQAALTYHTAFDLAQSTAFQIIDFEVGNDNDQSGSGYLHLFSPSSTVFVKHFIARSMRSSGNNFFTDTHLAGYGNTTSAVDANQFKYSSGNIDSGKIKLYGLKDSA